MSQRRSAGRSDAGRAIFLCVLAVVLTGKVARAADRDLLLAVVLNARNLDTLVEVRESGREIFVQSDDFPALGLVQPGVQGRSGQTDIPLSRVQGVTFRVDEARQLLVIQADDRALAPQILGGRAAARRPDPSTLGLLVNYDVAGILGSSRAFAGMITTQANLPFFYVTNGVLVNSQFAQPAVRLSSTLTYPDWDGERDWQAGDVVSGGLAWTRPFRLGGVQLQSDFDMRPDVVTTPVPVLSGRVAVPSTVDVLVDGVRDYSAEVQAGPFIIRQPPTLTGAGEVTLVTRDAIGQQGVQTVPFYVSPALLAPGLASYSAEAGLIRTSYGTPEDSYRQAAGSASLRYGLSAGLTGEAHLEAGPSVEMGGIGAALNIANRGILSLALAESHSSCCRAGDGHLFSAGFDHVDRVFNLSVSLTARSRGFRDVPAALGDPVPVRVLRYAAGLTLGPWGTLRAAYVATQGGLVPVYGEAPLPSLNVGQAKIGSLTYTRPLGRFTTLHATAYRDFAERASAGVEIGISAALGPRRSADLTASLQHGDWSAALDGGQTATEPGQFGGRLHLDSDPDSDQTAEATYLSQYARTTVGVEHDGPQNNGRAELQGSLVLADGGLFAADQVADSYAIVDTQGQPGIPVLSENRLVGVSDSAGRLLVPNLRGWDDNRIAIDPSSLPGDVEVDDLAKVVRPIGHGGVAVRFRMKAGDSALIRLVQPSGQPPPAGAMAVLDRTRNRLPVGYDGEVFATGLRGRERLRVSMPSGECIAAFSFQAVRGEIPTIGPVLCAPEPAR